MSSFIIKLIAVISMIFDHVGYAIFESTTPMNIFGRLAFPLFAFQTAISYEKTHSKKKYAIRLLIFALVSFFPYIFYYHNVLNSNHLIELNVMFTLLLGVVCMYIFDLLPEKINPNHKDFIYLFFALKYAVIALIAVLAQIFRCDYGAWGVLLILMIHIFYRRKDKTPFILIYVGMVVLKGIDYYVRGISIDYSIYFMFADLAPMFIMLNFDNTKGRKSWKWFFYAFYPLHLWILSLIPLIK